MRKEVIGNCELYLADCREVIGGLSHVDTVVTSPPYNCDMEYDQYKDLLPLEEYKSLLAGTLFPLVGKRSVVNVGQYIGSRSGRVLSRDVLKDVSPWPMVDEVIWDKGPANGAAWGNYPNSPRIRASHESIFLFGNPKMDTGNGLEWDEWSRLTTSIWRISPKIDTSVHPAMMPYEIARRCVALWTDVNDIVLDPFMGSGTTAEACVKLNRKFIGVEISQKYFEISLRRIENASRQGDMFSPEKIKKEQFTFTEAPK